MKARRWMFSATLATLLGFLWTATFVASEAQPQKTKPSLEKKAGDTEPDAFIPDARAPRQLWINLEGELPSTIHTKRIRVRVISGGGNNWVLPVYFPTDVSIDRTKAGGQTTVTVKLLDCLSHPQVAAAIEKALKDRHSAIFQPATPIDDKATMVLWLNKDDNQLFAIGTATCYRSDGKLEHTLRFKASKEATTLLADAKPDQLGVECSESFLGRFYTKDLEATLTISKETAVAFKNQLSSNPKKAQATFLVAIGGDVDQRVALQERFRQRVTIEIARRKGAENSALVEKVIDRLFENVKATTELSKARDDAVVTFLLSNGVRLTAALGDIKKMTDGQKTELKKKLESSDTWTNKDKHETEFGVKMEGGGWGFSASTDVHGRSLSDTEHSGSRTRNSNDEDLKDIQRAVEGNLPVAVLSADQVQQMASRSESQLGLDISTFQKGQNTLTHRMSFQAFAVVKAGRAEALSRLLDKKLGLESACKKELEKLAEVTKSLGKQIADVEETPKQIKESAASVPPQLHDSQLVEILPEYCRHFKAIHWPPPGIGWDAAPGHLLDNGPKGKTRRDASSAAQKSINGNLAAIKTKSEKLGEALTKSKQLANQAESSRSELVRLQAELDKVNKELTDYLER